MKATRYLARVPLDRPCVILPGDCVELLIDGRRVLHGYVETKATYHEAAVFEGTLEGRPALCIALVDTETEAATTSGTK